MKRPFFSIISLLLSLCMILSTFASCVDGNIEDDTSSPDTSSTQAEETTSGKETEASETQSATETQSDTETVETETSEGEESGSNKELEGEHAAIIELNNSMANGVQAYFTDGLRNYYNFTNKNMTLSYARSTDLDQQVAYIQNTKGNTYLQNTMDVFMRMTDGNVYYASQSTAVSDVNLYRFGYYYYEGLFEYQNFIPKNYDLDIKNTDKVVKLSTTARMMESEKSKDGFVATITDKMDPCVNITSLNYDSTEVNVIVLTAKATGSIASCRLYVKTSAIAMSEQTSFEFSMINDGEFHTYVLMLNQIPNYSGTLQTIRLDPAGEVGDSITLQTISFGKTDMTNVPSSVSINRHFHVYSDKMHQEIQFATLAETSNVAEVGMITKLPTDTVEKIMIKDKNGEHTSLEGIDWANVECVGFDVKDAGVFGFIMPVHETAGSIIVTEEDGNYVIIQSRVPTDNKLIPSVSGELDENGNHTHAEGVKNNGNDFYLSHRIYTDENHDFAALLAETHIERNPISENQVKIGEGSDNASFGGYDPVRGIYVLNIGMPRGFNAMYENPQKNYRVNFTIATGKNTARNIYIMTAGRNEILECAAILDANNMMLPIPIEVIKNFSEADGEKNLYNISDTPFSEAIFMIPLEMGEKYEYSVLNLYQNWGNYPLKQLSSIPFVAPYYHLSTGVTETNCILPWFSIELVGKGRRCNTLPDFRGMSAPFWPSQPQHNSCGSHSWLEYTDAEGNFSAVESKVNTIMSYGPTYAEVEWENLSDDGKIKVTYTHMEMPQLDENRVYYTMEYTVLEDVTINDVLHNFQFYGVTDNDSEGSYKRIGYLNENNEIVYVDANTEGGEEQVYLLGDNCPYFSFFGMPDWKRDTDGNKFGYSNVSFLIYNSEFVLDGIEVTPQFAIVNSKDHVRVTLNEGDMTFKAGDTFTINAILLPWGSQQYDDGIWDPQNGNFEYDQVINEATGEKYLDKNVRDVRENSLLNPLTATSESDEIIESPFLPRIRSKDGKTATFTLSGGENNVTVRAYGFDMLTAPKVEELVDGNWVEYKLNSADNPINGFYHYYDGYSVQYDGDGTYSYSFVVTMTDGAPRTFRVYADKEFEGWPAEILPEGNKDYLKVYVDAEELAESANSQKVKFGTITNNQTHVTFTGNGEWPEAFFNAYVGEVESGEYFVIKYRVPATSPKVNDDIEIYTSTENAAATATDRFEFIPTRDGEWHVAVFKVTESACESFFPADNSKYYARFIRIDVFNAVTPTDVELDIAFVGMDSSLEAICLHVQEEFPLIDYYEGNSKVTVDTYTCKSTVKTYIDPSSGYTESDVHFSTQLDTVNPAERPGTVSYSNYSAANAIRTVDGYDALSDNTFTFSGWCVALGGVSKYVWSADGGKTWNDVTSGTFTDAIDAMTKTLNSRNGLNLTEEELNASRLNGSFQSKKVVIELSEYAGKEVDLILAAIPASDTEEKSLMLLYCFENVSVSKAS